MVPQSKRRLKRKRRDTTLNHAKKGSKKEVGFEANRHIQSNLLFLKQKMHLCRVKDRLPHWAFLVFLICAQETAILTKTLARHCKNILPGFQNVYLECKVRREKTEA